MRNLKKSDPFQLVSLRLYLADQIKKPPVAPLPMKSKETKEEDFGGWEGLDTAPKPKKKIKKKPAKKASGEGLKKKKTNADDIDLDDLDTWVLD